MTQNPWQEQHAAREAAFQDTPAIARAVVANEYLGAPDAVPCDCGGQAHYKATIGAMKCTSCGALFDTQGDPI